MSVVIETTIGDLTVDLYLKERPTTCLNFLKLCKIKYYNLCLFHKIEKNFIAQSGDPTGNGRGGESIFCHLYGEQAKYFESEFKPRLKHEKLGTISMVNNGNNMNGSQFFLTLGENLTYLDEVHTVFGEVVEGFPTLLKLNEAICDDSSRPYQDIRITHTVVLHDPYDDPAGLVVPNASPEPTREQLESGYIAADEEIDDTKGKSAEEIEERIKESEAKARATILEMVGDIPDADVKPPENVLFVCKLNPVTTSEDLEIIFSRFGTILSCEVIKDHKTGDSLQYAFIEFEKEEDCENAYFKMDNVLIDDRRIHVDFSQSVSKLNFPTDGKFSRFKASKNNVVLKNSSKKSDGYDLIFDLNSPGDETTNRKDRKRKSKTPEKRSSFKERRNDRNRSRSPLSPRSMQKRKRSSNSRHDSPQSHRDIKYFDQHKYSSYEKPHSSNKYHSSKGAYEKYDDIKKSSQYRESSRHDYRYDSASSSRERKHDQKLHSSSHSKKSYNQDYYDRKKEKRHSVNEKSSDPSSVKPKKQSHQNKSRKKSSHRASPVSSSSSSSSSSSEASEGSNNSDSSSSSSSYEKSRKKHKSSKKYSFKEKRKISHSR